MSLEQFFEQFEDCCAPDRAVEFKWSAKGTGFGGFYLYERNGQLYCDNELMGRKFMLRMLENMLDKAILTCPGRFDEEEETKKLEEAKAKERTLTADDFIPEQDEEIRAAVGASTLEEIFAAHAAWEKEELARNLYFILDTLHYSMSETCSNPDQSYYNQASEAMTKFGAIIGELGIKRP